MDAVACESIAIGMIANKSFERTVKRCGRAVLAIDCVLAGAKAASGLAAQFNR